MGRSKLNSSLDWSDYLTLLQIEQAGSLSAAARLSGVSHPTMMRRLNQIESQIGTRLFERLRQGYRPTAAGEELLDAARHIRDLTVAAERKVAGRDRRPRGRVVLTTTDTLFAGLLAPSLPAFRRAYPEILLETRVSNDVYDLARRDADIALRPAAEPEPYLVGRRLGVIRQAIYAARDLADQRLEDMQMIGPSRDMPYDALRSWLRTSGWETRCSLQLNSIMAIFHAACAGAGAAVLPSYLGEPARELVRRDAPIGPLDTDLWLLTHPDLQKTARVRATLEHFWSCSRISRSLGAS
jgi:DNA-binding transcriptional LysR family regulator